MPPEKEKKDMITIGKIVNAHGCRGWVRLIPLTDFPDRFFKMERVFVARRENCCAYQIEQARQYKQFILLKFKEVPDMNAALALKGSFLQVGRDQLVELPADTYYIFDLLGLKVYTTRQEYLGELKDVLQTGANDVYVVESGQGRPVLIPALKKVVKEVDLEKRQMLVELPEGLR
ncbi:MAG: ribosome maturation factor RimM [Bacillota bacterium]